MTDGTGFSAADVAVLTGNANNRGCNDGFGWGGEGILWIIVLFALFGWGGFGGGWGGNSGGFNTPSANGALTRAEMFEGFQGQNMTSALNGIRDGQFSIENALCNGFRDVIDAQNAGTQRIVDLITTDKIQSLQTELQSAQLQLANASQTNNIINALRPTPVPSYPVLSPYTSVINPTGITFGGNGCGCGTCGC